MGYVRGALGVLGLLDVGGGMLVMLDVKLRWGCWVVMSGVGEGLREDGARDY